MENKLSTAALAGVLAEISGKNRKFCEDFIRELFHLVADSLANGENVRIKGFGNFKLVEVDARAGVNVSSGERQEFAAHKKVVFTPAKEISALINAPFEMFESVEIDDELPTEMIESQQADEIKEERSSVRENHTPLQSVSPNEESIETTENEVGDTRLEEGSEEEEFDDIFTYEAYEEKAAPEEEPETSVPKEIPGENPAASLDNSDNPTLEYDNEMTSVQQNKKKFAWGFFAGAGSTLIVCLVIFMLGCFFNWWPVNFGSSDSKVTVPENVEIVKAEPVPVDTTEEPVPEDETTPEIPPVYDTVSTTRYLTTIAREHYGNFNFWPYIYLENQSFLGHPDRITPGTKVVVPPLSKYGVNPENKADIEAAKKKSMEIYARFK